MEPTKKIANPIQKGILHHPELGDINKQKSCLHRVALMVSEETPIPAEVAKAKHEEAKKLQREITDWMKSKKYLIETGIRLPEWKLVIYIPRSDDGVCMRKDLFKDFPDIESKAFVEELKGGKRKGLSMKHGRTPLLFGDGTSATLGAFVRETGSDNLYVLGSYHGNLPILNRDVFVTIEGNPRSGMFRLGKVVAQVTQADPVIHACLIEPDQEILPAIDIGTYVYEPNPPMYLRMHENASILGLQPERSLKVMKVGFATGCTAGIVTEYSRDVIENGVLLTDNIVTKHEDEELNFAAEGDTGAVVTSTHRAPHLVSGSVVHCYRAISLLYMADEDTKESFSVPLPRCLDNLGQLLNLNLELATERDIN